jgi:hypothetical protein
MQDAGLDRIGRIARLRHIGALGEGQGGSVLGQRALHEFEAWQDQSAEKVPVGRQHVHGGGGARPDHQTCARLEMARADQRAPAIHAQLTGMLVTIGDATLARQRLQPHRYCGKTRQCRLEHQAQACACHIGNQDAIRFGKFGQRRCSVVKFVATDHADALP